MDTPATAQGRKTRDRLVDAAAELIAKRGADGTSLDDVRSATHASKSQLYHYFGDKRGLVRAVTDRQCEQVISAQAGLLRDVQNWSGLVGWTDAMVSQMEAQKFHTGCPLGTLAAALADVDDDARRRLAEAFGAWRAEIRGALTRLVDNGFLDSKTDLEAASSEMLAAVQGGLLLSKTERDSRPLRVALDAALARLDGR